MIGKITNISLFFIALILNIDQLSASRGNFYDEYSKALDSDFDVDSLRFKTENGSFSLSMKNRRIEVKKRRGKAGRHYLRPHNFVSMTSFWASQFDEFKSSLKKQKKSRKSYEPEKTSKIDETDDGAMQIVQKEFDSNLTQKKEEEATSSNTSTVSNVSDKETEKEAAKSVKKPKKESIFPLDLQEEGGQHEVQYAFPKSLMTVNWSFERPAIPDNDNIDQFPSLSTFSSVKDFGTYIQNCLEEELTEIEEEQFESGPKSSMYM